MKNNIKYFSNPQTLEELKKQYRDLAMKHHPDIGGDTEIMKIINNEYDALFEILKDIHQTAGGEKFTARQTTTETPEQFKEIIEELLKMEDITIEIIGCFIWVTGNTKPYKDQLKEINRQ
jgi:DnaJ-class molecular chaperone